MHFSLGLMKYGYPTIIKYAPFDIYSILVINVCCFGVVTIVKGVAQIEMNDSSSLLGVFIHLLSVVHTSSCSQFPSAYKISHTHR